MDTISFEDGRYITIKKAISELQEKHGRLTIADIGCGKARYLKNLIKDFPDNAYYGVDISRRVLEYSDSSLFHLSEGTLTSIPFSDGLFDVVYASEALEHAIDINSSIREMSRVTKSGGLIIIIDKDREVLDRFEINEWEQWFDRDGLKDIMLKYCSDVYTMNEISYDDMPADGLFCAWIGEVK